MLVASVARRKPIATMRRASSLGDQTFANPTGILTEGDVTAVMRPVFDRPMTPNPGEQRGGARYGTSGHW